MKFLFFTALLATSLNVTAAAKNYVGKYHLMAALEQTGEAACFENFSIIQSGNSIRLDHFFFPAADKPMQTYTLVSADLSGKVREHAGSHDATGRTTHTDQVKLTETALAFNTHYIPRLVGIPLGYSSNTFAFSQAATAGVMNSILTVQSNLTKDTAKCVYQKIN